MRNNALRLQKRNSVHVSGNVGQNRPDFMATRLQQGE